MAKAKGETSTYVVLPNNTIRHSSEEAKDGKKPKADDYKPGDKIDLTKEEYESMRHAVGTPAEAKKAEALDEARKLLEDEERQKAIAEAGAKALAKAEKK